MATALPRIRIGKTEYFVDERLNEIRNVKDPQDREKLEGSAEFYVKQWGIKGCGNYGLIAGRVIVCTDNGKELFTIRDISNSQGERGMSPTELDAMAHYVVDALNKNKDFDEFYKKYLQ